MNSCRNKATPGGLLGALVLAMSAGKGSAIDIQFDFSYDTSDFFGSGNVDGATAGAQALASLNAAAGFFEGVLDDDLEEIVESPGNTWIARFWNPATGAAAETPGLSVAADTLVIYVGSRDLGGTSLGEAGPGWSYAETTGDGSWFTTIEERGEGTTVGSGAADFAPWGGSLTIDHDGAGGDTNWNYNHLIDPVAGQDDLYSVILHELGHVLGVGISDSWNNLITGTTFTGSAAAASYGSSPSVTVDSGHWVEGTLSDIYGTNIEQEAAFDPSITVGSRKLITDLDVAGLDDLGWDIAPVPEPGIASLLSGFLALMILRRRIG